MKYSPNLKKAMAEINAILDRYDIAAVVVIHEPNFIEYRVKLEARYSIAKQQGDKVLFKLAPTNAGNAKFSLRKVEATANMLHMLSIIPAKLALDLRRLSKDFDKRVDAEHGSGLHTSQTELDN